MPRPRTAKRAAGSPTPLEGKALAVAEATAKPTPKKGEPTLQRLPESRIPEKGGVGPQELFDALERLSVRFSFETATAWLKQRVVLRWRSKRGSP
jgi:hypothetical protein